MPQRFKSLVDKFGNTPNAMKQAGIIYATDQIIDLYANGITNVHVYTMNKPDVAKQIKNNLSEIIGL
jgi:methylenetetrahydrofolate reductase (NADPH)